MFPLVYVSFLFSLILLMQEKLSTSQRVRQRVPGYLSAMTPEAASLIFLVEKS
jgi:hypothetical protein